MVHDPRIVQQAIADACDMEERYGLPPLYDSQIDGWVDQWAKTLRGRRFALKLAVDDLIGVVLEKLFTRRVKK